MKINYMRTNNHVCNLNSKSQLGFIFIFWYGLTIIVYIFRSQMKLKDNIFLYILLKIKVSKSYVILNYISYAC